MATEAAAARPAGRPRPWLLVSLGVAIAVYAFTLFWPEKSAVPSAPPSNAARSAAAKAPAQKGGGGPIGAAELKVRLEDLQAEHPSADAAPRNPFKFYVPPPPPTPPAPVNPTPPPQVFRPPVPTTPPVPPIPLKFFGVIETKQGEKFAAFSDCQKTWRGREGDIIAGQYRLLKIGVESVTMEYADKRAPQQMIRMTGQECVGR